MRVSDYIFKRLKEKYGVDRVFMITGGGAMHLNDAVLQSGLAYTCCHHEQACAIAAEGYVRAGKRLGVVNVTTGPGGLNTLTGVMGEWTDSVPVLYVSGQVKQSTTISACPDLPLRQLGDQEVDIISVVNPLTKYACQIKRAEDAGRILDEAVHAALSGRPGPVHAQLGVLSGPGSAPFRPGADAHARRLLVRRRTLPGDGFFPGLPYGGAGLRFS